MTDSQIFEKFECAPGLRLRAQEQLSQLHYDTINRRRERLEQMIERLERRLWLAVYGVAAAIVGQAFQSFLAVSP